MSAPPSRSSERLATASSALRFTQYSSIRPVAFCRSVSEGMVPPGEHGGAAAAGTSSASC
eukprot:33494-Chlamydomonas_euryale.AAC.1